MKYILIICILLSAIETEAQNRTKFIVRNDTLQMVSDTLPLPEQLKNDTVKCVLKTYVAQEQYNDVFEKMEIVSAVYSVIKEYYWQPHNPPSANGMTVAIYVVDTQEYRINKNLVKVIGRGADIKLPKRYELIPLSDIK